MPAENVLTKSAGERDAILVYGSIGEAGSVKAELILLDGPAYVFLTTGVEGGWYGSVGETGNVKAGLIVLEEPAGLFLTAAVGIPAYGSIGEGEALLDGTVDLFLTSAAEVGGFRSVGEAGNIKAGLIVLEGPADLFLTEAAGTLAYGSINLDAPARNVCVKGPCLMSVGDGDSILMSVGEATGLTMRGLLGPATTSFAGEPALRLNFGVSLISPNLSVFNSMGVVTFVTFPVWGVSDSDSSTGMA